MQVRFLRNPRLRQLLRWGGLILLAFHSGCAGALLSMRWITPPFTALQVQRRVESWFESGKYTKRHRPVPLQRISRQLRHAVIAAEDGRFYQHHGIDWLELRKVEKDWERGRPRGGSTITQQLVKNLFFTSHRSPVRKIAEFVLAPLAECLLSKDRILELYLNLIEWGPGVFGAEAAARYHYGISAASVNRELAARLAAVIPAPRTRKPQRMHGYSAEILERMSRMGW
jgi:monofunctional biosynthetic peptidoglycan transglycosylase